MNPPIFLEAARAEMIEATRYYSEASPLIAADFATELARALELVTEYPQACPIVRGETRRKVLRRFPFSLLFTMLDDRVVVVAVMHHHRRPDYWHHRMG